MFTYSVGFFTLNLRYDDLRLINRVNNAGVAGPKHALEKGEESTEDFTKELTNHGFADWNKVYETNVVGFYFNAVTFLPLLKAATEQSKGWSAGIVNITSMSGITSESQNHVPYVYIYS